MYVVLAFTNIIIGQLNTKIYDSDNGIAKFCIRDILETHFHLVLFENWHDKKAQKQELDYWQVKNAQKH